MTLPNDTPTRCEHRARSYLGDILLTVQCYLRDKPHACELCHKKFALACNLRAHMKTHEERPLNCNSNLPVRIAGEALREESIIFFRNVASNRGPMKSVFCLAGDPASIKTGPGRRVVMKQFKAIVKERGPALLYQHLKAVLKFRTVKIRKNVPDAPRTAGVPAECSAKSLHLRSLKKIMSRI
ncbi:unnamed protein product [Nezara viridula]|uniref:C2H2-type domain-containing protein n=1 Tax=Nezara viridula TaxID=85310 RepID=A0A9P0HH23_NEZVI|nr:unnamed protein product [Nezara viridula]